MHPGAKFPQLSVILTSIGWKAVQCDELRRIEIDRRNVSSYAENALTTKRPTGSFDMRLKTRFLAGFTLLVIAPSLALAQAEPLTTIADPAKVAPPPVVIEPSPMPVPVPAKPPAPAPKKKAFSDGLKPGQYVWEKRASEAKDLRIVAVIDIQRIYVFDGSTLVAFSTISTGKKGHATPTGSFKILQKNIDHKSNIYSNAPMPYMQRLTWDGIALHAGHIPGYAASHGCLRLPLPFAKALYGVTKMDQPVIVLADLSTPAPKPEPVVTPEPVVKPAVTDPVNETATPEKPVL
jgi:lipoprotein-anchoring transpeptidase ErfK/SrfK